MATQPYAVAGSNYTTSTNPIWPYCQSTTVAGANCSPIPLDGMHQRLEAGQPSGLNTRRAVAGHNRLPRVAPSSKIVVSKRVKMGW